MKSAPELWAEVSDSAALARHLAPFGSVRITGKDPERLVEWEGDRASGAIRLEPSGFGTRVRAIWQVVHLSPPPRTADPQPEAEAPAEPPPPPPPPTPREAMRRSFWGRFRRRRVQPELEPEPAVGAAVPDPGSAPEPEAPPAPPDPLAMTDESAQAVLNDLLDSLGSAHHRPFSRI